MNASRMLNHLGNELFNVVADEEVKLRTSEFFVCLFFSFKSQLGDSFM